MKKFAVIYLFFMFALANSVFAQYVTVKSYKGRFFPKNTTSFEACHSHAMMVGERIQKHNHTIISTGCKEYGAFWQVLVEFSSDSFADFDKFESSETTVQSCEDQLIEAQKLFDQKFPGNALDMYCLPYNNSQMSHRMFIDYKRPKGFFISSMPYVSGFSSDSHCESSLAESVEKLSEAGFLQLFKQCSRYSVSNSSLPAWGHSLYGFISVDWDFKVIVGPVEDNLTRCMSELGDFSTAIETTGATVAGKQCRQSHLGWEGVATIFEKRLTRVTDYYTEQRYPDRFKCETAKDVAISSLSSKVKVLYASCRPTSPAPSQSWSFKIWYERPKSPVQPTAN